MGLVTGASGCDRGSCGAGAGATVVGTTGVAGFGAGGVELCAGRPSVSLDDRRGVRFGGGFEDAVGVEAVFVAVGLGGIEPPGGPYWSIGREVGAGVDLQALTAYSVASKT